MDTAPSTRPVGAARRGLRTDPHPAGEFRAHAFESSSGHVHLALVFGEIGDGESLLTRVLGGLTGDALGSLRCDCGIQLRSALRNVAAEGRGIVLYLNGHEGRGIGLVNKLRLRGAGRGADIDANLRLGLHADLRDYGDGAAILGSLGSARCGCCRTIRARRAGLRRHGVLSSRCSRWAPSRPGTTAGYLETEAGAARTPRADGPAGRAPRCPGRRRHACSARCARAPTGPTSS